MTNFEEENIILKRDNELLNNKIKELETKLKKYSNPERNKKYYHENKDEIKQRDYKKSTYTKEQRQKWNKAYYEKNKAKKANEENDNIEI